VRKTCSVCCEYPALAKPDRSNNSNAAITGLFGTWG
jgi:hypothetical protein